MNPKNVPVSFVNEMQLIWALIPYLSIRLKCVDTLHPFLITHQSIPERVAANKYIVGSVTTKWDRCDR